METLISVYCHRVILTSFHSSRHVCNGFANSVMQFLTASPLNRVVGLVRV